MRNLIGQKLDVAIQKLNENNIKYVVVENNHNVNGDTTLVTNVKTQENLVIIYTGQFVFDVLNKPQQESKWNKEY